MVPSGAPRDVTLLRRKRFSSARFFAISATSSRVFLLELYLMPGAAPEIANATLSGIAINLLVAMTVVEAVQQLDQNLFVAVVATLAVSPSAGNETILFWSRALAVRIQMAQLTLVAAKDVAAELLGRVLDASLESRADGQPFKHWATLPPTSCVYEAPTDLDRRSTIPGAFAVGLKSPNLSFSSAMPFFAASKSDNVAANGGRLTIASSCASQNVCVHSWRACSCCVPRFSSLPQKLQGRLKSQIFKSGRFPQSQNRVCVRVSLRRCPGSLSVGPRAVSDGAIFQS